MKPELPAPRFGLQGFTMSAPFKRAEFNSSETIFGSLTATWELPPCMLCGNECVFTDGVCAPCWARYA